MRRKGTSLAIQFDQLFVNQSHFVGESWEVADSLVPTFVASVIVKVNLGVHEVLR